MPKCPKCNSELEISREELCSNEIKTASANIDSKGYFGETSAEYGSADRDLYQKFTEIKETSRCKSCSYLNIRTFFDVSEPYCKD